MHSLCMPKRTLCDAYCSGLVSEEGSGPTEAKGCSLHVCMVHRYIAVASQTEHQKLCYHHAIVLTSTKGSHRTGRNMSEISLYLKLFCHIQSFTSSEVHLPKSCEG